MLRPSSWFRQTIRGGLAAVVPRRRYIVRGPRRSGAVCLTFDDGPHPEHTPKLLDLLRDQQVRGTFFVIGREAEKHPELVKRIVAEGHALGNHSYSHRSRGTLDARGAAEEVAHGAESLRRIVGSAPTLYRPPQGKVKAGDFWRLWSNRQTIVLWNADPKDYARNSCEEVLAWFKGWSFRGGDVVLLHDNHPYAGAALPEIVSMIRGRGLSFATVREWAL